MRLFYVSEIVEPLTSVDVQVILGQAQIRNRRLDVTGMLAKSEGHFCQIIEGRAQAVATVMECVTKSRHHRDIKVLLKEQVQQRSFGRWAMCFLVRDDMAAEMQVLHQTGQPPGGTQEEFVARLMMGPVP